MFNNSFNTLITMKEDIPNNQSNTKIKVLIIDDEPNGVVSAKAGLFPLSNDKKINQRITAIDRAKLANLYYDIKTVTNVKSAIKAIDEFKPDLAIIDINLKDTSPVIIDEMSLENGIDIYRYLNLKNKNIEKLLFSNNYDVSEYYNNLTTQERSNLIPKSRKTGYEALASRINEYLKNISKKLYSEISNVDRENFLLELRKQNWKTLEGYKLELESGRQVASICLCLFESYPILESRKAISLRVDNPKEILENLFVSRFQISSKSNALWDKTGIKNIFHYIKENKETFYPIIDSAVEQIISDHILKMDSLPYLRHEKKIEFLLADYIKEGKNHTNVNFIEKFTSALAVRRALIFFERYIQENYENNSEKIVYKIKWLDFFKKMPEQVLIATSKNKTYYPDLGKGARSQFSTSLNVSIKTPKDMITDRQQVNLSKSPVFEFEEQWFDSDKCLGLIKLVNNHSSKN